MKNSATSGKNPKKGGRRYALLVLITASVVAAILLNSCGSKELPSSTPSAPQESGSDSQSVLGSGDDHPKFNPTITPTIIEPTEIIATNTVVSTNTPEIPDFTDTQLEEMAKELEQLSTLVKSTDDDLGVAGDNTDSSPNFFIEGKNPNSEQLKKLTQNFLNIVFSGRIDLLEGMTFPPYTFSLSPDAPSTDALSLTGQPSWIFTSEMNKQLKDAGIIIIFGGYAMPDAETTSVSAQSLFGGGSNNLQIFINGAPDVGPGGSITWVEGFHDRRGLILGLPDDNDFLSLSSSMPSQYYLTQMKVKIPQIKIPIRADGTLGINSVTIISTNGGRSFESIISALSNSAEAWGLGPIDGSARVKFINQ